MVVLTHVLFFLLFTKLSYIYTHTCQQGGNACPCLCPKRAGIFGTTLPTSKVHSEGEESEDVKTPAILVVYRTTLLSFQHGSACSLHQGHQVCTQDISHLSGRQ